MTAGIVIAILIIVVGFGLLWKESYEMGPKPAYVIGAEFQAGRVDDGGGWRSMSEAPTDGTVIEVKNSAGVAPHYGLHSWRVDRFGDPQWYDFQSHPTFFDAGNPRFSWRPYSGDIAQYVDPTHGAQDKMAYWRGASAASHGLRPDFFESMPNLPE